MTQNNNPEKINKALYLLMLLPVFMFGVMGGFFGLLDDNSSPLTGFLWGIGIGTMLCVVMLIGMFGWEWIKKKTEKGKLLPFMIVGFIAAIAISGFLAINLGNPSCEEYDPDPRGGCISYADDGYETTSEQRWEKFWGTLPVTTIITSLVAVIVRNEKEKNKKT